MHKNMNHFRKKKRRGRLIVLLFTLNLFFLIQVLITAILRIEKSLHFIFIYILIDILISFHIAILFKKNINLSKRIEEYYINKNFGANAVKIHLFHKLLDENLFIYEFQPIIDVNTCEIFGYEALMRTAQDRIPMVPAEILDLASKENRLYDIEKLSFYNTLKIMQNYPEVFETKKLFINSIPTHMLSDEDFRELYFNYKTLFDHIVIEVSDALSLNINQLNIIGQRYKDINCQFALDEYGSGYSTEADLLNFKPHYIKIDRKILHYISIDIKKQLLLSNLIIFAKQNNIKVIAVGIENYDELEYVIKHGVDYIQGFYTAMPNQNLLPSISKDIIIKMQNLQKVKITDNKNKMIFETSGEAFINTSEIISGNYSSIMIREKEITIQGNPNIALNIYLQIPDDHNCTLTLDNVSIKSTSFPSIIIGNNSSLKLILVGNNSIEDDGIRVPETSDLHILGDGNLTIHANKSGKIGIGGNNSQSYGNITLSSKGNIQIFNSGNISIGIGGGLNPLGSVIRLLSGKILITTYGYTTLCIGSILGNSNIEIDDCSLHCKAEGTKSVAIGSIVGAVELSTLGNLDIICVGRNSVILGTMEEGTGSIIIKGGIINLKYNAFIGTGIGAINGKLQIEVQNGDIRLQGEGYDIIGIGDHISQSFIKITNGILSQQLLADNSLLTGNIPQIIIIDGGNIQCNFPDSITPVNSYGIPLVPYIIANEDEFCQLIETLSYSYIYKASYSNLYPFIKVYLPANSIIN